MWRKRKQVMRKCFFTCECLRWSDASIQCKWWWLTISRTVWVNWGSELVPCAYRGPGQHMYRKIFAYTMLKLMWMLTPIFKGWYHSPWMDPAIVGCGRGRDTGWRAAQAEKLAPDSSLSSHSLVWPCIVTSADKQSIHPANIGLNTCAGIQTQVVVMTMSYCKGRKKKLKS